MHLSFAAWSVAYAENFFALQSRGGDGFSVFPYTESRVIVYGAEQFVRHRLRRSEHGRRGMKNKMLAIAPQGNAGTSPWPHFHFQRGLEDFFK
jgi:hypothetical protein